MTAPMKQRAFALLWIVGAAAVALVAVSGAVKLSTSMLGIEIGEFIELALGILAAIGGWAWGLQSYEHREGE